MEDAVGVACQRSPLSFACKSCALTQLEEKEHLISFLARVTDDWRAIHIPCEPHALLIAMHDSTAGGKDAGADSAPVGLMRQDRAQRGGEGDEISLTPDFPDKIVNEGQHEAGEPKYIEHGDYSAGSADGVYRNWATVYRSDYCALFYRDLVIVTVCTDTDTHTHTLTHTI